MPKIIKILTIFYTFEPVLRVLKRNTLKNEFLDQLFSFSELKLNLSKEVFARKASRNSRANQAAKF